jgi:hypothetical protein
MRHRLRLRQRDGARVRRRLRLARLAVPRSAAPAALDKQAVNGIRHAVQGCADGRQAAEPLPSLLIVKADLEHHAPAVRMPRPVDSALVSAASIRAESCCSCHRKAENPPCRTSIDHSAIRKMTWPRWPAARSLSGLAPSQRAVRFRGGR